jgi:hypothetical protein
VSTANAIAAVIHDQLGQVLTAAFKPGGKNPIEINPNPNDGLLKQLQEPRGAADAAGECLVLAILQREEI